MEVTPSPVFVDDSDPSIHYSGTWILGGMAGQEYMSYVINGTLPFTCSTWSIGPLTVQRTTGHHSASRSLVGLSHFHTRKFQVFTYTAGTSIYAVGTVPVSDIDGHTTTASFAFGDTLSVNVTAPQTTKILYNHTLWTSPPLGDGEHTLTVTALDVDQPLSRRFWIDYLAYAPGASEERTPSSAAPLVATTGMPLSSMSSTSAALTASPGATSPSTGSQPAGEEQHSTHITVIVVAVVVPVAVLAIAVLLWFWRRKRRSWESHAYTPTAERYDKLPLAFGSLGVPASDHYSSNGMYAFGRVHCLLNYCSSLS